jgi:hypothetical protein
MIYMPGSCVRGGTRLCCVHHPCVLHTAKAGRARLRWWGGQRTAAAGQGRWCACGDEYGRVRHHARGDGNRCPCSSRVMWSAFEHRSRNCLRVIVAAPSQPLCPTTLLHLVVKAVNGSPLPLAQCDNYLMVGDSILMPTARLIIGIQKAKINMHPRTPHIPPLHSALLIVSTRNMALHLPPPTLFLLVPHHIARASPAAVVSCACDSDTAAYARDAQFRASGDNGAVQWSRQHGANVPCSSHCLRNPSTSSTSQSRAIIFDGRTGANTDFHVSAPAGSPHPAARGKALAPLLNIFVVTNHL